MDTYNCPACGGQLELDDKAEIGTCPYCSTKVPLCEVKKIKIKYDETKKAENYRFIADDAFSTGNYSAAYDYYTKYLECDTGCWTVLYKRGLSAAYLSNLECARFKELDSALKSAISATDESERRAAALYITDTAASLIEFFSKSYIDKMKRTLFTGKDVCGRFFDLNGGLLSFASAVLPLIGDEDMESGAAFEESKKKFIKAAVFLCNATPEALEYHNGYRTVQTKNGTETRELRAKSPSPVAPTARNLRLELVSAYNGIPSTVAGLEAIDKEITEHIGTVERYENALALHLESNKEVKAAYRRNYSLPFLIAAAVTALGTLALVAFTEIWILAICAAVVTIGLLISALVFHIIGRKKRKEIEKTFPEELTIKKEAAELSRRELERLREKKDRFIQGNMIR